MEEPVVFKNNLNQQLVGMIHRPKKNWCPAAIICDGFNGSKSRPRFVKLGRELAKRGIVVLRFDFSGHGDSEGEFENFTIRQEIKDLEAAFRFLSRLNFVDKNRPGLPGQSMASVVVGLFALDQPGIKTLVF